MKLKTTNILKSSNSQPTFFTNLSRQDGSSGIKKTAASQHTIVADERGFFVLYPDQKAVYLDPNEDRPE